MSEKGQNNGENQESAIQQSYKMKKKTMKKHNKKGNLIGQQPRRTLIKPIKLLLFNPFFSFIKYKEF